LLIFTILIVRVVGTYLEIIGFYDDHFVHSGLIINEASELINQAAAMFNGL